jgi:hypothetical protein
MTMITLAGIRNGTWCVLAFAIVACASMPPPTERLDIARTSLARAEQAQASRFAQIELDQARGKLAAAQAAVDRGDAEAAARMADQADVDAQLAESTARAREQEQRADDMDASLRDLRAQALKHKSTTE